MTSAFRPGGVQITERPECFTNALQFFGDLAVPGVEVLGEPPIRHDHLADGVAVAGRFRTGGLWLGGGLDFCQLIAAEPLGDEPMILLVAFR
jgi:hypothetical protein